jgi:hypothetical protein
MCLMLKRVAIITLATLCLAGPAFGGGDAITPETECYLRSSFTPSDDPASLSIDIMRAQILGQRSNQSRVYSALNGMLRQGSILSGVIAIQVDGSCDVALPAVRERLSGLASEFANTVALDQINEVNANWAEVSRHEFDWATQPTPIPTPH